MKLRIGTRKSPLAQVQTQWVVAQLKNKFPGLEVEIIPMITSGDGPSLYPLPKGRGPTPGAQPLAFSLQGDQGLTTPSSSAPSPASLREGGRRPDEGGLKALFTKEIEEALLENRIDLAVHSLKDMAAELPGGLLIGAVPLREDPRDVWISRHHTPFKDLPKKSKVGTGAVRRQAQLRHLRPDLSLIPMRGNVETRLRKLQEEELDGILLAWAGLKRLGKEKSITEVLPTDIMLPAVGQGALAIEVREKNDSLRPYISALDHPDSHLAAQAERALLKALGGNCQTPIAAYAQVHGDHITLDALVVSPTGKPIFRHQATNHVNKADALGRSLAKTLLTMGADKIL